ncbi:hypothetical protein [Sunxiuqinia indica]|uniref:hypothetical protein n=1 Tax=Sunxiuqinia indica TaxID=2692584 RepID=UPI00135B596E|nr:hypothetical protein [Sunxiuqinia indica]
MENPASEIKKYIAFRYPNWLDYARHMSRVHRFESWAEDLLNDVILDLLRKPEDKLMYMLGNTTKKIVNNAPTTELDKFVLKMIQLNACSQVAPFRKNTLGQKVIARHRNKVDVQRSVELNGYDAATEEYNAERAQRIDHMHARNIRLMKEAGYTADAIQLYEHHYIKGQPIAAGNETALYRINQFLIKP